MSNFGRDSSCLRELRTGRFVTGPRLVAEAAYRRLTTPRGMLRGAEEEEVYGLDLADLIGSATTAADKATWPGRIAAELKKDERIETVSVSIVEQADRPGSAFIVTIDATTGEGPFSLQLGIEDVTIDVLGIRAEG